MYWRCELFCAFALPSTGIFLAIVWDAPLGPMSMVSCFTMSAMLVLGAAYWCAKYNKIESADSRSWNTTMRWARRMHRPMAMLTLCCVLLQLLDLLIVRLTVGGGDRALSLMCTAMAALEYVNYYHRQLQHFDHWPDFVRLMQGRGFRTAHLRDDLLRLERRSIPMKIDRGKS